MKSSIKLKYGKELAEVMQDPILLSIVVQVAFNMEEETGEAVIEFPREWRSKIGILVVSGILEHTDYKIFSLTNKKVVDITLKRKPSQTDISKQDFRGAEIIPAEVREYYDIAKAFWELFYHNLTSIKGRVVNLERAKFGAWVDPIRLMVENDGVTLEQLREVFKFLQRSEFWKDKVQSTQKMREKFNTLYNQLKSDEKRGNNAGNGSNGGRKTNVSTDYVKRVFNDLQS